MKTSHCNACGLASAGPAEGCEFCGCPYLDANGADASIRFIVLIFAAVSALAFSEVFLIHLMR